MIGELTGPRGEPTAIILLNGHETQLQPTFTKEVSLCNGWCLTQELTMSVKVQRKVSVEYAVMHTTSLSHPSPKSSETSTEEGVERL